MHHDSLGNPVTLHHSSSLNAVNDFVEGFISCEARVVNILQVADQEASPYVQACCAALHMFAENAQARHNALPFITRALATLTQPGQATAREQQFIAAVAAWVRGDLALAQQLHEAHAQAHSRDLAALKLGQYHCFNAGNSPGMLRLAQAAEQAASDVPYFHGMLAFALEQCHFLDAAERAARQGMRLCHKEPWAHHALAHVMLTQGRLHEGLHFMREVSPSWTQLNSFMQTHNWWHLALFALELGQHDETLHLYDTQVWGVVKDYSQDQIGAVSLLARLEFAGVDVGARWQDVGNHLVTRTQDQVLPFLDLQYLYGLARAGRPQAHELLSNLQQRAASQVQAVTLPAARGLLAHAQGDYARAATELGQALPRMTEIGGSHAQRDLFEQCHLDALMRSGQWVGAQNLVQARANAQPESMRLARQALRVNEALGLTRPAG